MCWAVPGGEHRARPPRPVVAPHDPGSSRIRAICCQALNSPPPAHRLRALIPQDERVALEALCFLSNVGSPDQSAACGATMWESPSRCTTIAPPARSRRGSQPPMATTTGSGDSSSNALAVQHSCTPPPAAAAAPSLEQQQQAAAGQKRRRGSASYASTASEGLAYAMPGSFAQQLPPQKPTAEPLAQPARGEGGDGQLAATDAHADAANGGGVPSLANRPAGSLHVRIARFIQSEQQRQQPARTVHEQQQAGLPGQPPLLRPQARHPALPPPLPALAALCVRSAAPVACASLPAAAAPAASLATLASLAAAAGLPLPLSAELALLAPGLAPTPLAAADLMPTLLGCGRAAACHPAPAALLGAPGLGLAPANLGFAAMAAAAAAPLLTGLYASHLLQPHALLPALLPGGWPAAAGMPAALLGPAAPALGPALELLHAQQRGLPVGAVPLAAGLPFNPQRQPGLRH